ncbi:30S ribosomal protein S16 [Candidatus Gracilibacteria bacterium]|nr:30S ribosomal protein S16 [Candidatus Gracilibacteria bacterium]
MLKIRLSRTGKKSQASYRLLLQEHTSAVKGKFLEVLGHYTPTTKEKVFVFDADRVKYWLSVGAQPSDSVAALLKRNGVEGMEKFMEPRNKKRKSKKAPAEEPTPAPVAAAPAAEEEKPAEEAPAAEEEKPAEEEAA